MTLPQVNTAEHTEGPWRLLAVGDGTSRMCPADAAGVSLLTIVEEDGADFAAVYRDADARLIAAAPELLDAAREALRFISDIDNAHRSVRHLRAAISKATGTP